ncbi:hypothetical protein, partial [Streptomyces sp. NPDC017940]|uniref:hypothetical protein n=1 Tax=Streptomyces sp. NPDC017940 TaxID=3365017 RepID=UPI0037AE8BBB
MKVGETKPAVPEPEGEPSPEQAAWRAQQKERARTGETTAKAPPRVLGEVPAYVPEGQGALPWHEISDFRITDSLVAR